jgi:hypothetical protein
VSANIPLRRVRVKLHMSSLHRCSRVIVVSALGPHSVMGGSRAEFRRLKPTGIKDEFLGGCELIALAKRQGPTINTVWERRVPGFDPSARRWTDPATDGCGSSGIRTSSPVLIY